MRASGLKVSEFRAWGLGLGFVFRGSGVQGLAKRKFRDLDIIGFGVS